MRRKGTLYYSSFLFRGGFVEWLHPFIALALCSGAVMTLLPQGSLRKTAALVIGLMMTLCWAECVASLLDWPDWTLSSAPALTETGYSYEAALASLAETLGGE